MRIDGDLINNALSYINPLHDRELDLRGHKIPVIENLGIANDEHDTIDFTDNDITSLGNFPYFPRLRYLLVARNSISHIQSSLAQSLPHLQTLILTANNMTELADIDPLSQFRLVHLSLVDNPITRKEHYRYWIIWKIPTVRFLDYQKVKNVERNKAKELFGTAEEPTPLATKIMGIKTLYSGPIESADQTPAEKTIRIKLTDDERARVEEMIRNATSLPEIKRLEKELEEGRIPGGPLGKDDDGDSEMRT
ncbi:U2 small nuclear ribonucleoprotein A [Penicillium argentinense]|uniref:U2 small nuclear ribonucleoprotein A' n=1 Tax=Penicillium argentinense TaxID=1131581 RepID=A0A9W9FDX0_9EURO|nr:U2 small nuclear ribonucleoprotein A [Penicillium argentinense]KAJ5098290.1 U2 small nuclear ribonucleoprotein A [Penicillium argentinense]